MVDSLTAGEYTHPVAGAVAGMEAILTECAETPLWSLSDKDLDELLPRAYGLLGRVMGSLVLPLVREADRRDLAAVFDAGNTAGWVQYLLRVTRGQARRLAGRGEGGEGDLAATGQGWVGGRSGPDRAQVIAKPPAALPDGAAEWVPAAAEQELLGRAEQYDPQVLAKIGRE